MYDQYWYYAINSYRQCNVYPLDAGGTNAVGGNDAGKSLAKLENDSEHFAVQKVNANLSKAIQQARIAKSMTQKALATAINEKPQVIQQYESGQAIPNPQVLNKLDRALGIHLPRKKKWASLFNKVLLLFQFIVRFYHRSPLPRTTLLPLLLWLLPLNLPILL